MMHNRAQSDEKLDETWRLALERAGLGVWDWNLATNHCFYSSTWSRMLGYEDGELALTDDIWLQLVHPDDREKAVASGERHIRGESAGIETEMRLRHKDGHWVWVIDRGGAVEFDDNGKPTRLIGVQTDISKQKRVESELARVNERFRLALMASGIGTWQFDIDRGTSIWDTRTREIFGLGPGPSEIPKETWHEHLHPEDRALAEQASANPIETHRISRFAYRIIRSDGQVRHLEAMAKFIPGSISSGRLVGTVRDVTENVLADRSLELERERLRVALKSISDAVITTDLDGHITFANKSAVAMLDRSETALVGQLLTDAFGMKRLNNGQSSTALAVGNATDNSLFVWENPCGDQRWLRCVSSPMVTAKGQRWGAVFTFQDVTEAHRREQELAFAARHDELTGLLCRRAFEDDLERMIAAADNEPFRLFYIDLDYFKALNDFAGHAAGDAALVYISAAIKEALPKSAVVARLGGDEFAAAIPFADADSTEGTAQLIVEAVRNCDIGDISGYKRLGASVGVASIRSSATSVADALARADDACYAAKSSGRNQFHIFCEKTETGAAGLTSAGLVADLVEGLAENRLLLFAQELREIDDPWHSNGRVEILTRFRRRDGTMIPPVDFITAAERFGVAPTVDRWIIRTALERYGSILGTNHPLRIAFNLSAQTISDPGLWDFVDALIAKTGARHDKVVFEITETAAVTNFEAAERFVKSARARKCRVSLDDFGAGLSSFEYLRRFQTDSVKINGSFVENLVKSRFDQAIVSSIAQLANKLGLVVIAEKIEDPAALPILKDMGVWLGQGFALHRPEPLEAVVERLGAGTPIQDVLLPKSKKMSAAR